jgi:hypothetical protein
MNNLQKIACGISGYEPSEEFTSAQDDGYYNQSTAYDRLVYIMEYSCNVDEVKLLDIDEAKKVFWFLESSFEGTFGRFLSFQDLK